MLNRKTKAPKTFGEITKTLESIQDHPAVKTSLDELRTIRERRDELDERTKAAADRLAEAEEAAASAWITGGGSEPAEGVEAVQELREQRRRLREALRVADRAVDLARDRVRERKAEVRAELEIAARREYAHQARELHTQLRAAHDVVDQVKAMYSRLRGVLRRAPHLPELFPTDPDSTYFLRIEQHIADVEGWRPPAGSERDVRDLVVVEFRRSHGLYTAGERAGFRGDEAAELVEAGVAVELGDELPEERAWREEAAGDA